MPGGRRSCSSKRAVRSQTRDVGRNRAMAKWGAEWLDDRSKQLGGDDRKLNVLTVCNTGSLATSVGSVGLPKSCRTLITPPRVMERRWA